MKQLLKVNTRKLSLQAAETPSIAIFQTQRGLLASLQTDVSSFGHSTHLHGKGVARRL